MNQQKKIQIENNLHNIEGEKIIDLSREILSIADYKWLADIIQKSSFIETIILPEIGDDEAEFVLTMLNQAMVRNSTLLSLDYNLTFHNREIPGNILLLSKQLESRLVRNTKKIFGIHGGGNIGLGLMADVVSKKSMQI